MFVSLQKCICWEPNPRCDGAGNWASAGGHLGGGAPVMELVVHQQQTLNLQYSPLGLPYPAPTEQHAPAVCEPPRCQATPNSPPRYAAPRCQRSAVTGSSGCSQIQTPQFHHPLAGPRDRRRLKINQEAECVSGHFYCSTHNSVTRSRARFLQGKKSKLKAKRSKV